MNVDPARPGSPFLVEARRKRVNMFVRCLLWDTEFKVKFNWRDCDQRTYSIFSLLRQREKRLIFRLPPTQGWRVVMDLKFNA